MSEARRQVALLVGRACVPGYIVFYGLWRLLAHGDSSWDTVVLIVGPVAAVIGVFLYSLTLERPRGQKSWRLMFFAFAGFAPWAFACYLVFYKGVWGLIQLWWDFSWWGVAGSVICAWIGHESVKAMDKLSSAELRAALLAETEANAPAEFSG